MKRFNSGFFIVVTIIMAGFAYLTFREAYARDEGRIGQGLIRNLLADMFNIMRFPTHNLLSNWSEVPLNFSVGLIINCLLYALVLERTLYFITRPKPEEDTD